MSFSRLASAAFLAVLVASPALAQPQAITIGVYSFGFSPKPIHLRAGQPVTLTFVNQSGHGHDFTAPEFFAASAISAGAAPGGKVALAGHQTKTVTLTPRAGSYTAHCSHFLHSSMGMTGQIIVN
jgi:plastocyanin